MTGPNPNSIYPNENIRQVAINSSWVPQAFILPLSITMI